MVWDGTGRGGMGEKPPGGATLRAPLVVIMSSETDVTPKAKSCRMGWVWNLWVGLC